MSSKEEEAELQLVSTCDRNRKLLQTPTASSKAVSQFRVIFLSVLQRTQPLKDAFTSAFQVNKCGRLTFAVFPGCLAMTSLRNCWLRSSALAMSPHTDSTQQHQRHHMELSEVFLSLVPRNDHQSPAVLPKAPPTSPHPTQPSTC